MCVAGVEPQSDPQGDMWGGTGGHSGRHGVLLSFGHHAPAFWKHLSPMLSRDQKGLSWDRGPRPPPTWDAEIRQTHTPGTWEPGPQPHTLEREARAPTGPGFRARASPHHLRTETLAVPMKPEGEASPSGTLRRLKK